MPYRLRYAAQPLPWGKVLSLWLAVNVEVDNAQDKKEWHEYFKVIFQVSQKKKKKSKSYDPWLQGVWTYVFAKEKKNHL